MAKNETTSIRLSPQLRQQLEQASHLLHRGKNWIINHALQEYIHSVLDEKLIEEAKRQSLLARRLDQAEEDHWEDNLDDTGWK